MGRTISIKRLKGAVVFLLLILGVFSFTSYSETKVNKLNNSKILKEKKWVELVRTGKNNGDLWYKLAGCLAITCDSIYLVTDIPTKDGLVIDGLVVKDGLVIKKYTKDKTEKIGQFFCDTSQVRNQVLVDGNDIYFLYFTYSNINIWKYTPNNKWQLIYSRTVGSSDDTFSIQLLTNKKLYLISYIRNISSGEEKAIVINYKGIPGKWNKVAELPERLLNAHRYEVIPRCTAVTNNGNLYTIVYTDKYIETFYDKNKDKYLYYDKNKDKYPNKIVIKEEKLGDETWTIEEENLAAFYYHDYCDHAIDYSILAKNNEIYIEYTRRDPENREGFDLAVKKIKGNSLVDVCHLPGGELIRGEASIPSYDNFEVMDNGDIYLYNVLELVKFHNGSSDIIYKAADSERIEAMCVYNEIPYILVYKSKEENYILKYLSKD